MITAKIEQLLCAGAYLQARREAQRLLLNQRLALHEQGQAYALICRASLSLGELFAAIHFGQKALYCAQTASDISTQARITYELGATYAQLGDVHLAEQHLTTYLQMLRQHQHLAQWEGMACYHLANCYRQRRTWPEAAREFRRAANRFEQNGATLDRVRAILQEAWCDLMADQPAAASMCLTLAGDLLLRAPDDQLMADLLCRRALLCRLQGDILSSTTLCQEIFIPQRQGVGDEQRALAAWIMGENALDLGHYQETAYFIQLSLDHATKANHPSIMNLVSALKQRLIQQQSQQRQAE